MKQTIVILVLIIGLSIWGHFSFPNFDSYMIMIGLISLLVIAHEIGHFVVAKKVGVKVDRFGFGLPFGPTIWEKQIGGTKFCLHPVLLGGYVSFPDDDPDSPIPSDSPMRFENKPLMHRAAIAVAGVAVNLILGYLIMLLVVAKWGYPAYFVRVEGILSPDSPAAAAGLMPGDVILKVGDKEVNTPDTLIKYLNEHKRQTVHMEVYSSKSDKKLTLQGYNGPSKKITVTPDKKGKIGVALSPNHEYLPVKSPIEVFTSSYMFLHQSTVMNFQAIGEIFTGKRSGKDVSGPVGIVKLGGMMIEVFGIKEGFVIAALISVILGVMNILPIPMLDGGHLLFMFLEKVRGKPLRKELQERIIQVSFIALIGLMCLILWNDINTHILGN